MASSKLNFRCIVCDLDTTSLCNLHKHQSRYHTAEELSLSSLALQSFIYHKHYFQTLDTLSPKETCYFYPLCSQSYSGNGKAFEKNCEKFSHGYEQVALKTERNPFVFSTSQEKTRLEYQNIPKKQEQLRRPLNTNNFDNPQTLLNSEMISEDETIAAEKPNSHVAFVSSANALCNDLMKFKEQRKLKRKRLNEKTEHRPRKMKGNSTKVVVKPTRKPTINRDVKEVNKLPQSSLPGELQTLEIWASKTDENVSEILPRAPSLETSQQIKLESSTVPIDMINCENALIFNSEMGGFQWNPLNFVEKPSENNVDTYL